MYNYAQLTPEGICHTVCTLKGELAGKNLVPIDSQDEQLLGKKWKGDVFYGLQATVEDTTVYVMWRDIKGSIIGETEEVKALCLGEEIIIEMNNGQGIFEFSADEPGKYEIIIYSESGCQTRAVINI